MSTCRNWKTVLVAFYNNVQIGSTVSDRSYGRTPLYELVYRRNLTPAATGPTSRYPGIRASLVWRKYSAMETLDLSAGSNCNGYSCF
eukprot:2132995-Rhodomonas_salina.2